jgi:HEXXH motif-containing protein
MVVMSKPTSAGTLVCHSLPIAQLDALAGGRFDRYAIRTLQSVERSRRLLLLRAFLYYARLHSDATGPLPPVDDAWQLIIRAEGANRQVVEEMLADPQTGIWLGHTLRRLRGVNDDQAPLWFHVGQLHSFAVAAAVRAGIRADMAVPVWNGVALLPSLGYVRLPVDTGWNHAKVVVDTVVEISCAGAVTAIDPRSDQPSEGWFPAKWFRLGFEGKELSIRLDDDTAYRGLDNPTSPVPLPAAELDRWRKLLTEAWSLLVSDHPERAEDLAISMMSITPLPASFRFRPRSISVEDGFGAAILSEPYDAAQLAVTLVHEFEHSKLNGIRHVAELIDGDDPATGYAPWRDDPRPLGGLIHGLFAFTAIAEFWAVHRHRATGTDASFANFEFALWRRQASTVFRTIRNHQVLTTAGARFLDRIGERLAPLMNLPVPAEIAALAETAAVDHATAWRACHVVPDADRVAVLVNAWVTGAPAPPVTSGPQPAVCADRSGQRLDAKAALMRVQLTDPELFNRLHTEPDLVPGASPADVAFVAGDLDIAHKLYLEELALTPNRGPAWSGFGLTLAAMGEPETAEVVLGQPGTLRAVTARLTGNDRPAPSELAAWLRGCAG